MFDPREVPPDQPIMLLAREIAAPAALIFNAFGDAATIGSWWGPTGFTTTTERLDFRVGGDWLHTMIGPDGTAYPNYTVYREIVPHSRLVYDHATAPGEPFLFRATIELTELGPARTRVVLESRFTDVATRDQIALHYGAVEGGRQHLMKLDGFVTGARRLSHRVDGCDLMLTRDFAAPPAAVSAAWTEAEALKRWWGPHGFAVPEAVAEAWPGGRFRVVVRAPDGTAYPLDGQVVAAEPGRHLVISGSVAEHPPAWHAMMAEAIHAAGGAAEATVGPTELIVDLHDDGAGTRAEITVRSATAAEARAYEAVGSPAGWGMSFERLDAVLLAGR